MNPERSTGLEDQVQAIIKQRLQGGIAILCMPILMVAVPFLNHQHVTGGYFIFTVALFTPLGLVLVLLNARNYPSPRPWYRQVNRSLYGWSVRQEQWIEGIDTTIDVSPDIVSLDWKGTLFRGFWGATNIAQGQLILKQSVIIERYFRILEAPPTDRDGAAIAANYLTVNQFVADSQPSFHVAARLQIWALFAVGLLVPICFGVVFLATLGIAMASGLGLALAPIMAVSFLPVSILFTYLIIAGVLKSLEIFQAKTYALSATMVVGTLCSLASTYHLLLSPFAVLGILLAGPVVFTLLYALQRRTAYIPETVGWAIGICCAAAYTTAAFLH